MRDQEIDSDEWWREWEMKRLEMKRWTVMSDEENERWRDGQWWVMKRSTRINIKKLVRTRKYGDSSDNETDPTQLAKLGAD